jgi:hypothetical protein
MNNFIRELNLCIQTWSIPKHLFADKIILSGNDFAKKCNAAHSNQFTGIHLNQLKNALCTLQNENTQSPYPGKEPRQWFIGKKKHE